MLNVPFDFWMFMAGLGMFLLGMRNLEDGINGLAGKSFRNLLQRFTNRSWKGILTGTFITMILQSSSMVTLLVLAFLGAGILNLKSALGMVLGANLGTTFSGWVVATLGFKLNIADFSYPFLAIGILLFLFFKNRPVLKNIGIFCVGFGLLFLGLDFMKNAVDAVAEHIDISLFSNYGLWAFLLTGLVVTVLIQSSSATIVIILSALNTDLLDMYQSTAMLIGASLGTTATMVMGAMGGTADKKRLALANVLFNIFAGTLLFIFMDEAIYLVMVVFGISDPLIGLVLLYTLMNVVGILLIYPFLGPFQRFLEKRFKKTKTKGETRYIKNVSPKFPDAALKALDDELKQVYLLTQDFIVDCYGLTKNSNRTEGWKSIFRSAENLTEKYERIKRIEDEITIYYTRLQEQNLDAQHSEELASGMMKLRATVYAAKYVKDVMHNIKSMMESEEALSVEILKRLQGFVGKSLNELNEFITADNETKELPAHWEERNDTFFRETLARLYQSIKREGKNGVPISTMTNVANHTVTAMDNLYHAHSHERAEPIHFM